MQLKDNLKKIRKEAGLTQNALAKRSGLSFSMVSKLESGEQTNPSFETLEKIAKALKISPGELIQIPLSIEEQIDEYIEYKRGLKQKQAAAKGAATGPEKYNRQEKYNHKLEVHEETYTDLNFMKKLQAINGMPRPKEDFDDEYLGYLHRRPEIRRLFSAAKNSTKDEIEQVIQLIETFKRI